MDRLILYLNPGCFQKKAYSQSIFIIPWPVSPNYPRLFKLFHYSIHFRYFSLFLFWKGSLFHCKLNIICIGCFRWRFYKLYCYWLLRVWLFFGRINNDKYDRISALTFIDYFGQVYPHLFSRKYYKLEYLSSLNG